MCGTPNVDRESLTGSRISAVEVSVRDLSRPV
jgi:hypothetical protein